MVNPLAKVNNYLDRRVRAALALLVTVGLLGAWFYRGEVPRELEALALFAWGYYFGQPSEAPKST